MAAWATENLGSVAEMATDKISLSKLTTESYISTENMLPDRGGVELAVKLPASGSVNAFLPGDVLFSNIRTYFKKVWLAPWQGGASADVIVFRPREGRKIESQYLYYVLSSDTFIESTVTASKGTKMPRGDKEAMRRFQFALPPLPIQRRIAGILSAYDELIENSQRRIKILESMARALYREWFVHFRFPGHESVPRVPSPLGEIPQGWEGTIGDVAAIERDGINPFDFPDEQFEHFSIPAFDGGRQPTVEAGEAIRSNKYCIDGHCVLLSKLNPRIPRVWAPSPTGKSRAITSTEFLVLRKRAGFSREFIYAMCCSEDFASRFASLAIGTSTSHQRVRPENVLAMPSIVPSWIAIEQFTNHAAPILAASDQLRSTVQNLRRTRDLLLPRLLSGQIDVEAMPS
jgi:type I restriction enzyme S subunit